MRVVGRFIWTPHAFAAASGIAAGLIVSHSTEAQSNISPVSHPHVDFMWWMEDFFPFTAGGAVAGSRFPERVLLDLRGKRKIQEVEDTLFLNVESQAGAVDFAVSLSVLLALP